MNAILDTLVGILAVSDGLERFVGDILERLGTTDIAGIGTDLE